MGGRGGGWIIEKKMETAKVHLVGVVLYKVMLGLH